MEAQSNAARLIKIIETHQDHQLRQKALQEPEKFIEMAEQQGYCLDRNHLAEEVEKLAQETIASIWNPGIGPRRHLIRR
jgi:DNA-binding IclR family transcriptional regulator